ncbi:phosphopantetheine-binding protein [Actinomadura madurae]|uniref:phosphopantetheine-binding protein n=1 Tax=Actinomadura madurae TaxID=1993 RepID=UPI0020D2276C|nr:phosphopantetheine-binding protein [Actinomadura madurae]MCQ0021053.1 phosphopantetheine-binding protein [Actinomadura madurae]
MVAEVLGLAAGSVDHDAVLTVLGLDSFTAVRLRRRLRDLGLDLPMTAFLGAATARTVAAGIADPGEGAPSDEGFPLTPLQTAYWIGRNPGFPLGGVATFYYREYDRVPGPEGPEEDLARLTLAWNRLVEHHPMLRMVVDGEGRQHVLPAVEPYEIEVVDLRAVTGEEAAAGSATCVTTARTRCGTRRGGRCSTSVPRSFRTAGHASCSASTCSPSTWRDGCRSWTSGGGWSAIRTPCPAAAPISFAELVERRAADPDEARRRERDREYWRGRVLPAGPRLPWATDLAELRSHRFGRWAAELPGRGVERAAGAGGRARPEPDGCPAGGLRAGPVAVGRGRAVLPEHDAVRPARRP